MEQEKNRPLILGLDFGGSGTKTVGGVFRKKKKLAKVMSPEVIEVPKVSLESRGIADIKGADENRAWVGVNGKYYAVGYLAKSYLATPQLRQLKSNLAIYKALSACWVYSKEFKLGNEFEVAIGCFLPPGEYKEKILFEQNLEEALSEFETPDGTFKVSLIHFECKPEGLGIFLNHWTDKYDEASNSLCANLMFGYRNASVVLVEKGNFGDWQTSDLGFIKMVKSVQRKTAGYTIEALTEAIARWDGTEDQCLRLILRKQYKEERERELQTLKAEIEIAKMEYVLSLSNWLGEVVPQNVSQIIISGGTADYLKPDLKEWAKNISPVTLFWHGGVELPEDIELDMGNRMADVWVLWQSFYLEVKDQLKAVVQEV